MNLLYIYTDVTIWLIHVWMFLWYIYADEMIWLNHNWMMARECTYHIDMAQTIFFSRSCEQRNRSRHVWHVHIDIWNLRWHTIDKPHIMHERFRCAHDLWHMWVMWHIWIGYVIYEWVMSKIYEWVMCTWYMRMRHDSFMSILVWHNSITTWLIHQYHIRMSHVHISFMNIIYEWVMGTWPMLM